MWPSKPRLTYSCWQACINVYTKYDNSINPAIMMTSSNGNIFRVTGPLWRETTGDRWIPFTKASDAELWCFLLSTLEQYAGFEAPLRSLWRQCNTIKITLTALWCISWTSGILLKWLSASWGHELVKNIYSQEVSHLVCLSEEQYLPGPCYIARVTAGCRFIDIWFRKNGHRNSWKAEWSL